MAGPDAIHTALNHVNTALAAYHQDHDEPLPWEVRPVSIITLIGSGLSLPDVLAGSGGFALVNTPVQALSQGASGCSLSLVVEPQHAETTLAALHQRILNA
ncbi:hypothetical protein HC928_10015 [bacterium]|nr:hypothetical protein [bacterium]